MNVRNFAYFLISSSINFLFKSSFKDKNLYTSLSVRWLDSSLSNTLNFLKNAVFDDMDITKIVFSPILNFFLQLLQFNSQPKTGPTLLLKILPPVSNLRGELLFLRPHHFESKCEGPHFLHLESRRFGQWLVMGLRRANRQNSGQMSTQSPETRNLFSCDTIGGFWWLDHVNDALNNSKSAREWLLIQS